MDHSLLSCALAREELLRELCHRAGQQEQGHEVRDAHQSVEGVGDAPQQAQIDRRAQNGHEGVDHEEGADHLVGVEQELDAPGAVEAQPMMVENAKLQSATAVKMDDQPP